MLKKFLLTVALICLCAPAYAGLKAVSTTGGGAGSVTVVGSGNLTATDIVTGGGSQAIQTPSNNATVDASGNLSALSVTVGGTSPTKSGSAIFNGVTSGAVALGVADVAGTAITYVLPSTNGSAGQVLEDNGVVTCPTYAAGTPVVCHQLIFATASGAGTVTTTGSPASGNIAKFSGASAITNGDLSGDITTSGTLATTVAKIAGVSVGTPSGTGNIVFSNSPTLITPALGTPSAIVLTNATGTAASLTVGTANAVASSISLPGSPTTTTQADGDNSTKIATTAYVQNQIAAQVNMHDTVQAATTATLLFSPSYSNGASGVGATLTGTSFGILIIDGYTVNLNDRVLVQNQASTFQNGCYTLTTVGTVAADYVLTRCTDFDQTTEIVYGSTFPVLQGATNANQQFTMNNNAAITVGTTAITFAQTSGGSQLTAGTGITITGNSIALTTPVTTTNGGLGANNSAATGVVQMSSGTTSISTALASGTTATTQAYADSSTKVATTAFVAAQAPVCTILSTDFSVTASTTLVTVTGLTWTTIAGKNYAVYGVIGTTMASAGGVKATFQTGSTNFDVGNLYASQPFLDQWGSITLGLFSLLTDGGATTNEQINVNGSYQAGAGATTLNFQIAQNTSNATATKAKAGSFLCVQQTN